MYKQLQSILKYLLSDYCFTIYIFVSYQRINFLGDTCIMHLVPGSFPRRNGVPRKDKKLVGDDDDFRQPLFCNHDMILATILGIFAGILATD